ncbi:MAG TPA: Uma2 family endonuclease [Terracidiphilus sp.]|jgi:Uma2 family endonuclease
MATTTQIALSEYLQTSYRPDREYVDGELQERNVGKTDHARVQALLAIWFGAHEEQWQIVVTTEQRIKVAADRVRIPDVTLVRPGALSEDVLSAPPLCVIEILSPDDTYSRTWEKAQDYRKMGVAHIWLIDPGTRSGQASTMHGWQETMEFEIPGTPVRLSLVEIFRNLDRSRMA